MLPSIAAPILIGHYTIQEYTYQTRRRIKTYEPIDWKQYVVTPHCIIMHD